MRLHVINHCNAWHEYSSFKLIGVVNDAHLEKSLRKIKRELHYSDEDMDRFIDVNLIIINDLDI